MPIGRPSEIAHGTFPIPAPATLRLLANLSAGEVARKGSETAGTAVWGGEAGETIPAWSVFWHIAAGN